MSKLRGVPALLAVCAIVVLLSLLGLASAFLTHLVSNIDGLLLLMICLMMGGIFALMTFTLAKEAGLLPARRHATQSEKATAANPAPANPGPAAPSTTQSGEGKS